MNNEVNVHGKYFSRDIVLAWNSSGHNHGRVRWDYRSNRSKNFLLWVSPPRSPRVRREPPPPLCAYRLCLACPSCPVVKANTSSILRHWRRRWRRKWRRHNEWTLINAAAWGGGREETPEQSWITLSLTEGLLWVPDVRALTNDLSFYSSKSSTFSLNGLVYMSHAQNLLDWLNLTHFREQQSQIFVAFRHNSLLIPNFCNAMFSLLLCSAPYFSAWELKVTWNIKSFLIFKAKFRVRLRRGRRRKSPLSKCQSPLKQQGYHARA